MKLNFMKERKKKITAKQFDKIFDEGKESILPYVDVKSAKLVKPKIQRFNVDLPEWAVSALDNAATRRGVARQALVKDWLVERLDSEGKKLVKAA